MLFEHKVQHLSRARKFDFIDMPILQLFSMYWALLWIRAISSVAGFPTFFFIKGLFLWWFPAWKTVMTEVWILHVCEYHPHETWTAWEIFLQVQCFVQTWTWSSLFTYIYWEQTCSTYKVLQFISVSTYLNTL